jgi:hypothetical protein
MNRIRRMAILFILSMLFLNAKGRLAAASVKRVA